MKPGYYILITRECWAKDAESGTIELAHTSKHPIFDQAFYLASFNEHKKRETYYIGYKTQGYFNQAIEFLMYRITQGVIVKVDFFGVDLRSLPVVKRTLFGQWFRFEHLKTMKRRTWKPGWSISYQAPSLERIGELLD